MRKFLILILILGILGASAFGGRRVYRHWKTQRAVKQAKAAFAKTEYDKGLLWLKQALSGNSKNVEAVRLMGDFAEVTQAPNTLYWRQRLADLQPGTETQLLLARAALFFREYETVEKALQGIDEAGKKTAEYHKFLGGFAVTTRRLAEAERSFTEAMRLEPTNPLPQLSLALVRMQLSDALAANQARRALEDLTTNQTVRTEALRNLALDAVRNTNYARAMGFAAALVKETNSMLNDRLVQLEAMKAAKSQQFQPTLSAVQALVMTNPPKTSEVARWMLARLGPAETFGWLETLPGNIRTNLPVTIVVADCYMALRDWSTLQAYTGSQRWGEMDYLRLALSARSLREQNLSTASKADWAKGFKNAGDRLDQLIGLERLASIWNWPEEREEVLWLIVSKFPTQKGAPEVLTEVLYFGGKTRSLLTLYAQTLKADPKDLNLKNNLASIALLLRADVYKPYALAREVYEAQPDNPAFASTYAFSLYLQNKPAEALQVMDKLGTSSLEQPIVAGYYGVILASVGDRTKAKRFIDLAAKGQFLPEERALFERAKL